MAAELAERLIVDGSEFTAAQAAEAAVVAMLIEVVLSECASTFSESLDAPSDQDVRDAAEAIAARASFDTGALTEDALAAAIDAGLADLRDVLGIEQP
jgi:hypothetical protein